MIKFYYFIKESFDLFSDNLLFTPVKRIFNVFACGLLKF